MPTTSTPSMASIGSAGVNEISVIGTGAFTAMAVARATGSSSHAIAIRYGIERM